MRASWTGTVLAVLAGLGVTACGIGAPQTAGGAPASPAANTAASTSPLTVSSTQFAPLTGEPATTGVVDRPAVAVVVAGARPRGLAAADVVLEEFDSPVRYIAVYQSQEAADVGPVTTTQPTDQGAVAVLNAAVAFDGGTVPYFVKMLDKTKVVDMGRAGNPGLYSGPAGNLSVSTAAVVAAAHHVAAPQPLFQYWAAGTQTLVPAGESRPSSVQVTVPGAGTQDWVFDSRTSRWSLSGGGPAFQASNLVIQDVAYKQYKVRPKLGTTVGVAQVLGKGNVEVFSRPAGAASTGTSASGTWSKPKASDVTNYFGPGPSLMVFAPGPTWVILAPPGTRVSTG